MGVEVKYSIANESWHPKEPRKGTSGSACYDLYVAEQKKFLPHYVKPVTTELCLQIPSGYYGKIYARSSLLQYNFVTVDGGVIDSDYRGIVLILMINHSEEEFEVDIGEKVAQVVMQKCEEVSFKKVLKLEDAARDMGGFRPTGFY